MLKKSTLKRHKGLAVIVVLMIVASLLLSVTLLTKAILVSLGFEYNNLSYSRTFYLAEAGLEFAKTKLADDPNWYTDLLHSPTKDKEWCKNRALGYLNPLPLGISKGVFKLIKEKGVNRIYSLGFSGTNQETSRACVVLYMEYSTPTIKTNYWEEL
ncbi:MAG: hypothetical protein NT099_00640 [Candidatus Saganbacteria bacterium]|nr:hypothetical protein [Candidatus Saganbacteria bacterium]